MTFNFQYPKTPDTNLSNFKKNSGTSGSKVIEIHKMSCLLLFLGGAVNDPLQIQTILQSGKFSLKYGVV